MLHQTQLPAACCQNSIKARHIALPSIQDKIGVTDLRMRSIRRANRQVSSSGRYFLSALVTTPPQLSYL
ncbi:MAG: hypothetical protein ACRC9T_08210, partial [Vibrionaceae bacterium]